MVIIISVPEFITFRADTLRKPGMVSLQVVPKAGVPADAKRPYYIGNTSVYLTGYKGEEPTDSIVFPGIVYTIAVRNSVSAPEYW